MFFNTTRKWIDRSMCFSKNNLKLKNKTNQKKQGIAEYFYDAIEHYLYCGDRLFIDYVVNFSHYQEDIDYLVERNGLENLNHNLSKVHKNYHPDAGT